jgi:hypothetical protein
MRSSHSLTARPSLVRRGFLATRANRTRRSFPLLRRKFQVLSDPSPEGPILASVFNQHNRCIAWCHSCLACEKTGHSRVERFLLLCRPTSAQEHLHEHDPVGSLDAEVARIIQKATYLLKKKLTGTHLCGFPNRFSDPATHSTAAIQKLDSARLFRQKPSDQSLHGRESIVGQ